MRRKVGQIDASGYNQHELQNENKSGIRIQPKGDNHEYNLRIQPPSCIA